MRPNSKAYIAQSALTSFILELAHTYERGIAGLTIEFADEALTTHASNWVVVSVDAGTCDPYRATCVVSHVVRGNGGWVMVEDGSPLDWQIVAHH